MNPQSLDLIGMGERKLDRGRAEGVVDAERLRDVPRVHGHVEHSQGEELRASALAKPMIHSAAQRAVFVERGFHLGSGREKRRHRIDPQMVHLPRPVGVLGRGTAEEQDISPVATDDVVDERVYVPSGARSRPLPVTGPDPPQPHLEAGVRSVQQRQAVG